MKKSAFIFLFMAPVVADARVILDLDAREYTPGSGSTWATAQGNVDGKIGGKVKYDEASQSFEFPGVGRETTPGSEEHMAKLVSVDLDISPSANKDLTIEVWFNLHRDHQHGGRDKAWLLGHDDGGFDRSIIASDNRAKGIAMGTGNILPAGFGFPKQGVWHHVICVWKGSTGQAYMAFNGEIGNTLKAVNSDGLPSFEIGGLKNHNLFFQGNVMRVKINDEAFDAPASKAAYNAFVNAQDELKRRTTTTTTTVTTENAEQKALKDRLDKLEDMLENDNGDKYATVEELQSVASSLNDIAGTLDAIKAELTQAREAGSANGARLDKVEAAVAAVAEEAIPSIVASIDDLQKASEATAGLRDAIKAGALLGVFKALAKDGNGGSGGDPAPTVSADGVNMQLAAMAGTVTIESKVCGVVDVCTMVKNVDKVAEALEALSSL